MFKRFYQPLEVAIYKNLEDPSVEVIVPQKNIQEFEEENPTIKRYKENLRDDYIAFRRGVICDELEAQQERKMYKKK